jgi:hypothetical protein
MDLTIQLDETSANQLSYIQQQINQTTPEIIRQAIDLYYNQLQQHPTDPLSVLKTSGFIGCGKADPNLSKDYKLILKTDWNAKHGDC